MNFFILFFLLNFLSCSNYIDQLHKQIDEEDSKGSSNEDKFSFFRRNSPSEKSLTNENFISSSDTQQILPQIKRKYITKERNRIKSKDLLDNDDKSSIWQADNQDQFLFTKSESKKSGDIVVIKVQINLKKEISRELNRYFPPPPPDSSEESSSESKNTKSSSGDSSKANLAKIEKKDDEKTSTKNDSIFDSISSIISEKINDSYVLLKGKKEILYYGQKREILVQALVSKKDIDADDSILSSKILETKINILR